MSQNSLIVPKIVKIKKRYYKNFGDYTVANFGDYTVANYTSQQTPLSLIRCKLYNFAPKTLMKRSRHMLFIDLQSSRLGNLN